MERSQQPFDTISPSALALLRLKSYTNIPFAHAAAQIVSEDADRLLNAETQDKAAFIKTLIHFENRYQTIDVLSEQVTANNFLEISSGFSFRGLDLCAKKPVVYFDTDLPDVIAQKETLLSKMTAPPLLGNLSLQPLDVMDPLAFQAITDEFPAGPICLLNEGLLMYLERDEKTRLASHVHQMLQQRGGCWITGDIYFKRTGQGLLPASGLFAQFRQQHRIDEKKFEDLSDARDFFSQCGFRITGKTILATERLSCLDYLPVDKTDIIRKLELAPISRETWCLEIA